MNKKRLIFCGLAAAVSIVIIVAVVKLKPSSSGSSYYTTCSDETSSLSREYSSAAVSSDASPCATIARDALSEGGSAIDATIAAVFCVGILNSQSSGLGGGFLALYYSKKENKVYALDARETAPAAAFAAMYDPEVNPALKDKKGHWWEKKKKASHKGGLAVAVPGEVAGLYELYTRFGGKLPWSRLIEPSIKLCEEGYKLTWYTGGITKLLQSDILSEPSMKEILAKDNMILNVGDVVKRPQLAKTLKILQKEAYALYNGSLVKSFVEDIRNFGGIITEEDLRNYRPKWRDPVSAHMANGKYVFYSFPPPGSGALLTLILDIIEEFNLTPDDLNEQNMSFTYQKVTEAFKFAYAKRPMLGDLSDEEIQKVVDIFTSETLSASIRSNISDDSTFQDPKHYGFDSTTSPADAGTAHFSLISEEGDAVSLTSSINFGYGAGIRSASTGIILNNQKDAFSGPDDGFSKNIITPGKRPLSSMSPSLLLDKSGSVRLCTGAAGGTMIPTSLAWVITRYIWLGESLVEATDQCRTHHQLVPMQLHYEAGFPEDVKEDLESFGHETNEIKWKSVVNSVGRNNIGNLVPVADKRKSGQIDGF